MTRPEKIFDGLNPRVVKKFMEFHRDNPKVYLLFKRFTFEMFNHGRPRYGIQGVAERIRWHAAVETTDPDFKLNNNHTACYARMLIADHPELEGFFQLRTKRQPVQTGFWKEKGYERTRC